MSTPLRHAQEPKTNGHALLELVTFGREVLAVIEETAAGIAARRAATEATLETLSARQEKLEAHAQAVAGFVSWAQSFYENAADVLVDGDAFVRELETRRLQLRLMLQELTGGASQR